MTHPSTDARSAELAARLLEKVRKYRGPPVTIMEVCGTHTVAVARLGLRGLLPEGVKLLSGPGCPVCVTPVGVFDEAIHLARRPDVILATFGDALRVPGSTTTLSRVRGEGAHVSPIYAATDALELAERHPDKQIVFLGLGFETTSPTVAHAVKLARRKGIGNFTVLSAHKALMPAMEALLADPLIRVGAFLCPGHASMVLGSGAYEELCRAHRVPCVIAGFEAGDVLLGILQILQQAERGVAEVENAYPRAVDREGNRPAKALLAEVFVPADSAWRGLGELPNSGYELSPAYAEFDARRRFLQGVVFDAKEPAGCRCADVLRGRLEPSGCPLFATACTPDSPVGACMVSSEGACGAHYRYRTVE